MSWLTEYKWAREFTIKTGCTVYSKDVQGSAFHLRRHADSVRHTAKEKSVSRTPDVKRSINNKITLKDNGKNIELKLICYL